MKYRLDRLLAELVPGLSRRQAKEEIRGGRVSIDGVTSRDPERKIDPGTEQIERDGVALVYVRFRYFLLNKPAGVLSATTDARQKTVLDLIGEVDPERYFPVGRLDRDTEGLLLITNDGELAHALLSPKKHVPKEYHALCRGNLTEDDLAPLREGVCLGDFTTSPAIARVLSSDSAQTWISLTITEGRFHQVKRMVAAIGSEVLFLRRVRMGELRLPAGLTPGQYRELTQTELAMLRPRNREDGT